MINEWVHDETHEHTYTDGSYPEIAASGKSSNLGWIAVVPAHRLCKEGYSYYEYSSDWTADANAQIRQFVESGKKDK